MVADVSSCEGCHAHLFVLSDCAVVWCLVMLASRIVLYKQAGASVGRQACMHGGDSE